MAQKKAASGQRIVRSKAKRQIAGAPKGYEIRPAFIHANMDANRYQDLLPQGVVFPDYPKDEKGRTKSPAWLLKAHKA